MMKKHLILYTGLLIALFLLLFMAPAAVAQTDGQPSKSAEQWASEGCQIINLADTAYGKDAEGFIALRKDINYLKETMNGSFSVNGNTLTCTNFAALQTGSGEFASTYCILAGRKIYFGEKDDASSNGILSS